MVRGAVVVGALLLAGCGGCGVDPPSRLPDPTPQARAEIAPSGCDKRVRTLHRPVERGISYVHTYDRDGVRGYGSDTSRASLRELHALGANWVSLMPFGFEESLDADEVRIIGRHYSAGETDERMRRAIADAHAAGMHVLLKPHIWIRNGDWIGHADPGSPERWEHWMESYREFALHYARIAELYGAETFAVGVELGNSEEREDFWRALVRDVRAVYHGKLVYCANWDNVARVRWWDAVDYVGVQFYAPLASSAGAEEDEMRAKLARTLDALGAVSARVGRPVLFTEVGYKSMRGTAVRPHEWPEQLEGQPVSASVSDQARAWRVFLAGIRDRPWVEGLYVWKWFTDPTSSEEGPFGFSPRGKPAEAALRSAFGGRCPR